MRRAIWPALLVALALLALPSGAAASSASPRLIGGSDAAPGTWQSMAFVVDFVSSTEADVCSGTVVSSNLVLTAAHCATDGSGVPNDPANYRVVTGSLDWTDSAARQVSNVSRLVVHPSWTPSAFTADAALLVLTTPTTAPAMTLATPADAALTSAGTPAQAAGWGLTNGSASEGPDVLQTGAMTVQSSSYCGVVFGSLWDPSWQLCALDPPGYQVGTCHGDSGGPLVVVPPGRPPVQVGITSFGPDNCSTHVGDAFARVDAVSAWVNGWIAALAPPPPAPPPAPPAPPPPPPPVVDQSSLRPALRSSGRPHLRMLGARSFLLSTGRRMVCPLAADACRATIVATARVPRKHHRARSVVIARGTLRAAGGDVAILQVRLSRTGAKLLRKHRRLRTTIRIPATVVGGRAVVARVTATLRMPKVSRKRR